MPSREHRQTHQPTLDQIRRYRKAAKALAKLGEEGCELYLANDFLHLMKGPTHDREGNALLSNSMEAIRIPLAGGGDW